NSAFGIQHDLQKLRDAYEVGNLLLKLSPGEHDIAMTLNPPEKLYGREIESDVLQTALQHAAQGQFEFILVEGTTGVGKSSLIKELHKPVAAMHGHFAAGKFEQFARSHPYQALLQVIRNLLAQWLSKSADTQRDWRQKIAESLGEDIQLLVNVLPELEGILDTRPVEIAADMMSVRYRFNRALVELLLSFADSNSPLVIFLDDLQWADMATLDFLTQLGECEPLGSVLLIGAYRDNEVGLAHPLRRCHDKLIEADISIQTLTLQPLSELAVEQLLKDMLNVPIDQVATLSHLCRQKTDNTPLFLKLFLQEIYESGLLEVDLAQGCWHWDTASIQKRQITDNVMELAVARLDKLTKPTRHLLQVAALLGGKLELEMLAQAVAIDTLQVQRELILAAQQNLLLMIEDENVQFKFAHDRIQQAVYQSIPEGERDDWHATIGRRLFSVLDETQRDKLLLELVRHLNHDWLSLDKAQRDDLLKLNLEASHKARETGAYDIAYSFSAQAMENMPETYWQSHYELCMDIHLNTLELGYACNRNERVDEISHRVMQRARNRLDKSRPYISASTISAMVKGNNLKALKLFNEATAILGSPIPINAKRVFTNSFNTKGRLGLIGMGLPKIAVASLNSFRAFRLLPLYGGVPIAGFGRIEVEDHSNN
ncbi:MAG: AAA family ATPase, partial [Pseudomonadota bacterium]